MSSVNPYQPSASSHARARASRRLGPRKIWSGPLTLLIALTAVASSSFNLAMMIAVCTLLFAGLALVWVIVAALQRKTGELARRGLYFLVLVAMAPIGWYTLVAQHYFLDRRMQPLIAAIESHKQANGHYPASLGELGLASPTCGAVGGFGMPPRYSVEKDSYSITCMTFGFNRHSYRARERRWQDWD